MSPHHPLLVLHQGPSLVEQYALLYRPPHRPPHRPGGRDRGFLDIAQHQAFVSPYHQHRRGRRRVRARVVPPSAHPSTSMDPLLPATGVTSRLDDQRSTVRRNGRLRPTDMMDGPLNSVPRTPQLRPTDTSSPSYGPLKSVPRLPSMRVCTSARGFGAEQLMSCTSTWVGGLIDREENGAGSNRWWKKRR